MVAVCTVLPPPPRPPLDAAGGGWFSTVHTRPFPGALPAARPGAGAGAAPPALPESAHAPFLPGGPAAPEALPRRYAARARGLPVLDPRALGGRRGVPPRLFVAAELRAPPEGDAGRHRG